MKLEEKIDLYIKEDYYYSMNEAAITSKIKDAFKTIKNANIS